VKILLDESVPRLLKLRLPHLDISTVQELGWAGVRNGELLRRAEEQFDIFVTGVKDTGSGLAIQQGFGVQA
jgi:hypothetical protein